MNEQITSSLSWCAGTNIPSPVREIVVLGFYDGPTEGVLRCADGCVYRFDLLTWDPNTQDLRVFAVAPLPAGAWDQLISLFLHYETPNWPVWFLSSWHEELDRPVEDILRLAGPAEWVVATEDFRGAILRCKAIRGKNLETITNWQEFLGLDQELPARFDLSGE